MPPELKIHHDDIVALSSEWITVGGRAIEVFEAADPDEAVESVIDVFDLEIGPYRSNLIDANSQRSCMEIEETAGDHGVLADLGCRVTFNSLPES